MEFGISLGSNLGDRLEYLRQARQRILDFAHLRLAAQSPVYETQPVDVPPLYATQDFLNAVLIVEGATSAERLADHLLYIEEQLGRRREGMRHAPRPIDLDLLYADHLVLRTPTLVLPHPRWATRRFVVEPLSRLRPNLRLPGVNGTVQDILASLPPKPAVRLLHSEW